MRVPSSLLSTRDTGANEQESIGLEFLGAADGIGVVRVATVDDNVPFAEVGLELSDEAVNGITSLDEEDDLARGLKLGDKIRDRVSADDVGA